MRRPASALPGRSVCLSTVPGYRWSCLKGPVQHTPRPQPLGRLHSRPPPPAQQDPLSFATPAPIPSVAVTPLPSLDGTTPAARAVAAAAAAAAATAAGNNDLHYRPRQHPWNITILAEAALLTTSAQIATAATTPSPSPASLDMWRGPSWVNTNYLVAVGLREQRHPACDQLAEWLESRFVTTREDAGRLCFFIHAVNSDLVVRDRLAWVISGYVGGLLILCLHTGQWSKRKETGLLAQRSSWSRAHHSCHVRGLPVGIVGQWGFGGVPAWAPASGRLPAARVALLSTRPPPRPPHLRPQDHRRGPQVVRRRPARRSPARRRRALQRHGHRV